MDKIKKNFGFGCMRLPMIEKEVDIEQTKKMVDVFLEKGFNYFDTAHGYIDGQSELALKECLTSRYARDKYILTNKLSGSFFKTKEDIRPLFEKQLEACGVEYFDFYLMHALNAKNFEHYKTCEAYETILELKEEGKIRHIGFSFHDTAEVLDKILTEYPRVEVVQLQFNYLDYENPGVQAKDCYEVCCKHGKPVIVMEPVKGGTLVNLPDDAKAVLENLQSGSVASFAIRYAAGFENIFMVLSGMSNMEQMEDNISFMENFVPLNEKELQAIEGVKEVMASKRLIACTSCRYCVADCPMNIAIPDMFTALNNMKTYNDWTANFYYNEVLIKEGGKASDCIKCGQCENACPQHLQIRDLLVDVAGEFEK